jgi:hypothetical protein
MQNNNIDIQVPFDETQLLIPVRKSAKARKWREIEALKARRELAKELREIDPTFELLLTDFF